ncbi:MAG: alpha-mannosyltransferase, partial [Specibacter sp.]
WLYEPGDLAQLRGYATDLLGDDAKRAAFGAAAFDQVQGRSWHVVCEQLMDLYTQTIADHPRLPAALKGIK